jgi:hypothetical protein
MPATSGQIERSADETGAIVRPLAAAAAAMTGIGASSSPSTATSPKRGRVDDHAPEEDEARPAAVDLAPAYGAPNRDGEPVRGRDEPCLRVVPAGIPHEQDERESGHAER